MSIIYGQPITLGGGKVKKPTAALTPMDGISYAIGISDLDADTLHMIANAISNNSEITNTTSCIYFDYEDMHREVKVGDQITLSLNGTNYGFDIIGFNHDTLTSAVAYGEATVTGMAGVTLQMHDVFATSYKMYSANNNTGGWAGSDMRTATLATMKGYLPSDWQSIIKPVIKVAGTGGGSSSGTEPVSDNCFLLSEIEVFGSTTYSVAGEGSQYAYYKAGNSKAKTQSGNACYWWERSPRSGNTYMFCCVYHNGTANTGGASSGYGVSFAFCV